MATVKSETEKKETVSAGKKGTAAKKSAAKKSPAKKTAAKKTTVKKTTSKAAAKTKKTAERIGNLLIVESPAKAKTIKKYLGSSFEVLSSKGHIRDLPASRLGVDVEHDFVPEYIVSRKDGKQAILKELANAAAKSDHIYLATDPDREGEAIAWHLAGLLGLDPKAPIRVTFNEITKKAVVHGVDHPRQINENLFNAQQTRRVLDRIVGYKLSPLLWRKVKKGLSAGRVQSVATRLVVEKERDIQAFQPVEYWVLDGLFSEKKKEFSARFTGTDKKKIVLENEEQTKAIAEAVKNAPCKVCSVKKQQRLKNPRPPFTTSSLQQDASSGLNMRPQVTMSVAQSLYEGVDIKGIGLVGLITYMRTDSLRISDEAAAAAKEYITQTYGSEYSPAKPHVFKTKASSQDAHEAIRPTDINLTPDSIKASLTNDQYRLYKMIWSRFLASRMASAVYDTVSVEISAGEYRFRASGSTPKFKGFTAVYNYSDENDEENAKLPVLEEGQALVLKDVKTEQKFTQPPTRYTEASLIRALEENGIGRPSTYAPTISTILERQYVEKDSKQLVPTQLGFITTDIMTENFNDIVDISFTAGIEEKLDEVEAGKRTYLDILSSFYGPFEEELKAADKKLEKAQIKVEDEVSDVPCELCGRMMVYKVSRYGRFLACPNYPECKNTKSIVTESEGKCPKCGKKMIVRKSKKGKVYFVCEDYKGCNYMTWDTPVADLCPNCSSTLFRHGSKLVCQHEGCGYEQKAPKAAKAEENA